MCKRTNEAGAAYSPRSCAEWLLHDKGKCLLGAGLFHSGQVPHRPSGEPCGPQGWRTLALIASVDNGEQGYDRYESRLTL